MVFAFLPDLPGSLAAALRCLHDFATTRGGLSSVWAVSLTFMTKFLTRNNLRQKGFVWTHGLGGNSSSWQEWHWSRWRLHSGRTLQLGILTSPHLQLWISTSTSNNPLPPDPLPPARARLPNDSTISQKSTAGWAPTFQMREPKERDWCNNQVKLAFARYIVLL